MFQIITISASNFMAKRRHEEFSRSSLSTWLESKGLAVDSLWFEVDQKDEPPDWYLELRSNRYAVEATSVVDSIWEFDPPLPSSSVSASLSHFIDRVEKEAKSRGPLNGAYLVSLAPIPNLREHEQWLFNELIGYIDKTRNQPSADEYELGRLRFRTLSISKFKSDREYVAEAISLGAKFEGQAMEDLEKVIAAILEKKASLLQDIDDPVILLLLDAFQYSHIVDWIKIVLKMTVPPIFESLFRTHAEYQAELLYYRSDWWAANE